MEIETDWTQNFVNELESIKEFFARGHDEREKLLIEFFDERNNVPENDAAAMKRNSIALREEANSIMQNSNGDVGHAATLYTEAMSAAPIGSEELAFAHANRALALIRLKYFESAYDDCLCALQEGYPVALQYKVILRQAHVAKELGELVKMKQHISQLQAMKLEASELEKVEQLSKALSEMEANLLENKKKKISTKFTKDDGQLKKSYEIVKTSGPKRRSMIATKPIKKGDTIFSERAFAFVCETRGTPVCSNCADTMFVPFPCISCSGKIVYCSLKCKQEHAKIHEYECAFIDRLSMQDSLLNCFSLRMLLEGFPEILPYLKKERTAQALWSQCFGNKKMNRLTYIKVIQSATAFDLDEKARETLVLSMSLAEHLVVYLKNYTNFFELLSKTAASANEWKIFISALILRHIGQHYISADYDCNFYNTKLNLLSPRVERGKLVQIKNTLKLYTFHPTLFVCNHACVPNFEKVFDGRYMRAVASRDIKVGEEINDCYFMRTLWQSQDQMMSKSTRQSFLLNRYFFLCECLKCKKTDKGFSKSHQYYCENPNCKKFYSLETEVDGNLICPHCQEQQRFNFDVETLLIGLLKASAQGRAKIFDRYDEIKNNFKDNNLHKLVLVMSIMDDFLKLNTDDEELTISELDKLFEIIIAMLHEYPIEMFVDQSQYLTVKFLWDIIALRGKKINAVDLMSSLEIVNKLKPKERTVFLNYYEDFIKNLLN